MRWGVRQLRKRQRSLKAVCFHRAESEASERCRTVSSQTPKFTSERPTQHETDIMPSMASSIHPDFRDDVTSAEAHAVDRETERLIHQQLAADNASGRERYIQLAKEMLRIRLRAYKPESPPIGGAWCLIGSAHLKASQLQEAKEATEKSLEIYAKGDDKDAAALAREQLALIFEGLGQISDAKNIRLQGASEGTMVCSSPRVR